MAEKSIVGYVQNGLKRRAHVVKHNDVNPGIADLSIYWTELDATRWCELKEIDAWPARSSTRVWARSFTEAQALFLRQRRGVLLIRVERSYVLMNAAEAWAYWEDRGWPREELLQRAMRVWHGGIVWAEFEELIS